MFENGKLGPNGWMFLVFLVLTLTTPINPIINHRYFTIWWYLLVALYGLWVLIRIVYREEDAR